MGDDLAAIVIDNGSGFTKFGFAGDDVPQVIFPNLIINAKHDKKMVNEGAKTSFIGNEFDKKFDSYDELYPMSHGIVKDWDDMEKIWHYGFDELKASPIDRKVLINEALLNPMKQRENIAEIMFEKFNIPGLAFEVSPLLSLFASGRGSGIVLECGDGVTTASAYFEGYRIGDSLIRYDFGGRDITEYLMNLLSGAEQSASGFKLDTIRKVKEQVGYVALDYHKEIVASVSNPSFSEEYELPDGKKINLISETFKCSEALFDPSLIGLSAPGVHKIVFDSIMKSSRDTRTTLLGAGIILSGGSTLFRGFTERLNGEINKMVVSGKCFKILAPPERKLSVWIGGSIMASLSYFEKSFLSKQDYCEAGNKLLKQQNF